MSLLATGLHPLAAAILDAADVPVLHGGTPGMAALALTHPSALPAHAIISVEPQPHWFTRLSSGPVLTEREAKDFLRAHGIPTTRESLATSADQAASVAAEIGFPVAMKIESPDIPHKTEAGGVRLGIADATTARAAFTDILANARQHSPKAMIAGVFVQEMVTGGIEALVGLSRHPPFGLAITAGPGGIFVELAAGHALDLLPPDADVMIAATKLSPLLAGFRGAPPADRTALAALLNRLGAIASTYAPHLAALDLNPVAVLPAGHGVRVLDALLIRTIDAERTSA